MSTPISDLAAILAPRPVIGLPVKTTMVVRRARGVVHSISATSGQVMVSVGHSTASLAVPATVPRHVVLTVGDVVTVEMFGTRVVVSGVITRGRPPWILATSGPPTTGTWLAQQQVLDSNDVLWVCTAGGTPGTWVAVAGLMGNPAGRMYLTATSGDLDTVVPCNATSYLKGGMAYTGTSYALVVPVAGAYAVSGTVSFATDGLIYMYPVIKRNGGLTSKGSQTEGNSSTWPLNVADVVLCAAGDKLQLGYTTSGGANFVGGTNASYFSAVLVSG